MNSLEQVLVFMLFNTFSSKYQKTMLIVSKLIAWQFWLSQWSFCCIVMTRSGPVFAVVHTDSQIISGLFPLLKQPRKTTVMWMTTTDALCPDKSYIYKLVYGAGTAAWLSVFVCMAFFAWYWDGCVFLYIHAIELHDWVVLCSSVFKFVFLHCCWLLNS